MGDFTDMANGISKPGQVHEPAEVFVISKRRSAGIVFVKQNRRVAWQDIPRIPAADPLKVGALWRDSNSFLKVSKG